MTQFGQIPYLKSVMWKITLPNAENAMEKDYTDLPIDSNNMT